MDEVLEYANKGGDTEPETAKLIEARNKALQDLADKQREAGKARDDAHQAALQDALDAEAAVAGSEEPNLSGAPVPPTAPAAPQKAASKSSS